jgi:signal peptidase I
MPDAVATLSADWVVADCSKSDGPARVQAAAPDHTGGARCPVAPARLRCAVLHRELQVRRVGRNPAENERPMSVSTDEKRQEGGFAETIRVIFHALIIAVVIRTFLFQPFNIPSGSMEATLLIGDFLFVSKYTYGYTHYSLPFSPPIFSGRVFGSEPKRGDVVVFRLPKDDSVDYIKRVIGLPGDTIQVIDGVLHINGQAVKREPAPDYVDPDQGMRVIKRWRETLPNGVSYTTLQQNEISYREPDNTSPYVVPAGHFFMMGDNRQNSQDSRFPAVGYVPFENIIGRAEIIFFSMGEGGHAWQVWRWPWAVRWSRLFSIVR